MTLQTMLIQMRLLERFSDKLVSWIWQDICITIDETFLKGKYKGFNSTKYLRALQ